MAFDVQINTPRGNVGLNAVFQGGINNLVVMGYLQQPDGTWQYKGLRGIAGGEITGMPNTILRECFIDMGIVPAGSTELAAVEKLMGMSQANALEIITRWLARSALSVWVSFINLMLGVTSTPQPAPPPGPEPVVPFQTAEHAFRASFKAALFEWNGSEVTGRFQ